MNLQEAAAQANELAEAGDEKAIAEPPKVDFNKK